MSLKRIYYTAVIFVFILVICTGCNNGIFNIKKPKSEPYVLRSFRDIPGVTAKEIADIEALKSAEKVFSLGVLSSTEAFIRPNGSYSGFNTLLARHLSDLFSIPFLLEVYSWDELLNGINNLEIDFLSAPAPEGQGYLTASLITERAVSVYVKEGGADIRTTNDLNGLEIGFIKGSLTEQLIRNIFHNLTFKTVLADNIKQAAGMLLEGEVDAVIASIPSEYDFNNYGKIIRLNILPFVYSPVCLVTANPRFEPVISVLNKYLETDGIDTLHNLYTHGENEYVQFLFESSLTPEETAYIDDLKNRRAKVPVAMESDNYPLCFYDATQEKFQGVAPDILKEISLMSGIEFENITDKNTQLSEIQNMVKSGQAALDAEMIFTSSRSEEFLWPDSPYFISNYVFLSKADYPDLKVYQVSRATVGYVNETAASEIYFQIAPNSSNHKSYSSRNEALDALEKDEIDLYITTDNILLYQTHFREKAGYKINISFDNSTGGSFLGLNKNEVILCSIINKAQNNINMEKIATSWTNRVYDYSKKAASERLIYMSIFAAILIIFLVFQIRLLLKNKKMIVKINRQNRLLNTVSHVSSILLEPAENQQADIDHFDETIRIAMCVMAEAVGVDRICIWINNSDDYGVLFSLWYEWEHGSFKSRKKSGCLAPDIDLKDHPDWNNTLTKGNCINSLVSDMVEADQTILLYRNIVSLLVVPVFLHDRFWGFVGFDHCNKKWLFKESELLILRSASRMMANTVIRNDMTEQLETAKEQAEKSNISKSIFLSHMSHEIRTPMNAILGIAEIQLQKENYTSDVGEAFEKIYESGDLLLNIINDILDLSKIESGKLEIMSVKYDLPSLINDTTQINRLRYDSKPIEFILQIDENLPLELYGDELRIKQILNNILSNAFKYTEEGKIEFSISVESDGGEDVTLVISVSDTGQGMTEEQIERLFEEYTRFNLDVNRTIIGAGLGMNITKRLVNLMNGGISVKSVPGSGSVFSVNIPQKRAGSEVCGKILVERLKKFNFQSNAILKKIQFLREYMPYGSVLIVDDVESNIYVAKGMMVSYGLNIDTASSGFEAIDKIKNGKSYDIIFMDHMMPKMDGIEAVKIIRSMGYTLPIVALTANALIGRATMFLQNGFDSFLSKPIDSRELNQILNDFIRSRKPPEVVEEARKIPAEKRMLPESVSSNSDIEKFFLHDAEKTVHELENINYDNDIDLYITSVHGIKSALANIGETGLSSAASMLEEAGNKRDTDLILNETPAFINALKSVIIKVKHTEEKKENLSEEDIVYLKEKLEIIKSACKNFEKNTAKAALYDLKKKIWSGKINNLLSNITFHILHSEFDEIDELIEKFNG
ncbi:MAG: transporter substrate-binding domain-containing protein [Treponema sp.]|nr:transporter substrate-binding domain-containing protein [Treponema sp.]